jgi:hypothetical protein
LVIAKGKATPMTSLDPNGSSEVEYVI